MTKVLAIVDENGRVLGAQFGSDESDDPEAPASRLLPMPGQRAVEFDVPDEVGKLSGPELDRFFSRVEFSFATVAKVPKIEVVKRPHGK